MYVLMTDLKLLAHSKAIQTTLKSSVGLETIDKANNGFIAAWLEAGCAHTTPDLLEVQFTQHMVIPYCAVKTSTIGEEIRSQQEEEKTDVLWHCLAQV